MLIRRNITTGELAFYRCYSPHQVPLRELVRVAGRRWSIEENSQAGEGLAGLDEHQVRRWISWQRLPLLAMIAHALLAILAVHARADDASRAGLIAFICQEIRRLFSVLIVEPARTLACPDLVSLATPPPTSSEDQPLPPSRGRTSDAITIYGWSIRPRMASLWVLPSVIIRSS